MKKFANKDRRDKKVRYIPTYTFQVTLFLRKEVGMYRYFILP